MDSPWRPRRLPRARETARPSRCCFRKRTAPRTRARAEPLRAFHGPAPRVDRSRSARFVKNSLVCPRSRVASRVAPGRPVGQRREMLPWTRASRRCGVSRNEPLVLARRVFRLAVSLCLFSPRSAARLIDMKLLTRVSSAGDRTEEGDVPQVPRVRGRHRLPDESFGFFVRGAGQAGDGDRLPQG